jgi:hypothetical protein
MRQVEQHPALGHFRQHGAAQRRQPALARRRETFPRRSAPGGIQEMDRL